MRDTDERAYRPVIAEGSDDRTFLVDRDGHRGETGGPRALGRHGQDRILDSDPAMPRRPQHPAHPGRPVPGTRRQDIDRPEIRGPRACRMGGHRPPG
ncbi:hypothetical protein GCM10027160_48190 [Streptomyces calidiresistens]